MNTIPRPCAYIGADHEDPFVAWRVYSRGKHIDTVFYLQSVGMQEIRKGLIEHDRYPTNIKVYLEKQFLTL